MKNKNYGEVARKNGEIFEEKTALLINNSEDEKAKLILKLKNDSRLLKYSFNYLMRNSRIEVINRSKVNGIIGRKTTSKADIWFIIDDIKIGISLKMSESGTQLQVIPLLNFIGYMEYNNVNISECVITGLKKFCGIIKPNNEELVKLNESRSERNKNKSRYWMNELFKNEQDEILSFLNNNKDLILRLILKEGLCSEPEYMADYFILNKSDFTKTGKISLEYLSYDDMLKYFTEGDCIITNNNSLEISKHIGLQRKGSGSGASKNSLQFKDRGYKNILEKIINESK